MMDRILHSLLLSDKKDSHKQEVIKRVINAGSQSNSKDSILAMFKTTMDLMLASSDPYAVKAAKEVYLAWAKSNRASLGEYFHENSVRILMEGEFHNPENVPFLMLHSLKMLLGSYPHYVPPLELIIKQRITMFIERNPSFVVVYHVCLFLHEFKDCIPQQNATARFCSSIVSASTFFSLPKDISGPKFIHRVNHVVGTFLGHIWERCDSQTIFLNLRTVFDTIQTISPDGYEKSPSIALAGLIQYIPTDFIDGATKSVVSDESVKDENMEVALTRMIAWLQWPSTKNIDHWVVAFLQKLAEVHKYSILINVTEKSVDKVFQWMMINVIRSSCFVVLSHMLLSFQHSPEAFHKIADKVPELLVTVKKEMINAERELTIRDAAKTFFIQFAELLQCLMQLHPGFPDLYEPIMKEIQDVPRPSTETIRLRLNKSKWGSRQEHSGDKHSSIAKWLRKSETGKAGLLNLGNTCYMNSVIQAIFMCDSFRRDVLNTPPTACEKLLVKLQHVFAFLSATNRAFYSPSSFLHHSRPPWFVPGHQQDCSEFLKYLLDQLHEEEINGQRLSMTQLNVEHQDTKKEKKGFFSHLGKHRDHHKDSKDDRKSERSEHNDAHSQETLIQRTFGGKLENTFTCEKCKKVSVKYESFNDLQLAFPENDVSSKPTRKSQRKMLSGGGSAQSENHPQNGSEKFHNNQDTECLLLQDLLSDYLKPEKLEGENRYHCDNCKSLQNAEKTIRLTRCPDYLVLTLMRFSYDIKSHSRTKIFTDVRYPKTLYVPCTEVRMSPSPSPTNSETTKKSRKKSPSPSPETVTMTRQESERLDVYALSSVIIHSGMTSDGGHYYCYSRHSIPVTPEEDSNSTKTQAESDIDYLQDKWYLFNDSRVSYSSYRSFSDITQKFGRDTAYVLLYKKIRAEDLITGTVDPNESILTEVTDPPLRRDLRAAVDQDNTDYIMEQEYQQRLQAQARKQESSNTWFWKEDDDRGPPGSCGGGGGGSGGFGLHQGPHFVF